MLRSFSPDYKGAPWCTWVIHSIGRSHLVICWSNPRHRLISNLGWADKAKHQCCVFGLHAMKITYDAGNIAHGASISFLLMGGICDVYWLRDEGGLSLMTEGSWLPWTVMLIDTPACFWLKWDREGCLLPCAWVEWEAGSDRLIRELNGSCKKSRGANAI